MKSLEVTLSTQELYFLSELMGLECIVGIKDPFKDCTKEQIIEAWLELKDKLLKMNILFEDKTYQIDRKHAILIYALRPESVCCWFNQFINNNQESCYYYFTPQLVVKRIYEVTNGLHKLQLIGTPIEAFQEMINSFSFSNTERIKVADTYLTKEQFDILIKLKGDSKFEEYALSNMNPKIQQKLEEFIYSLRTFQKAGQLVVTALNENQLVFDELNFIQGGNGVWLTNPDINEGVVKYCIKSSTGREIEEKIKEMVLTKFFSEIEIKSFT
ncbi:hypothetical protein [Cytobacillus sp. IB215316]|uniref:hypothetical protein n=1 Tax=Cytobacillus sp. IB215316 TaxID=3097354 RepID=UPI002A0D1AD3|nr:hypothetical protein [Cytobacillus sp. IB215316]MDX8360784.1 hypothetical protein [Cytobacillus sp. IB215316]